jgi:hypothetical protein
MILPSVPWPTFPWKSHPPSDSDLLGGLGVLAGDTLKSAADLEFPW